MIEFTYKLSKIQEILNHINHLLELDRETIEANVESFNAIEAQKRKPKKIESFIKVGEDRRDALIRYGLCKESSFFIRPKNIWWVKERYHLLKRLNVSSSDLPELITLKGEHAEAYLYLLQWKEDD